MSIRNSYESALLSLRLLMMAFAGLSTTSVAYAGDSSSNGVNVNEFESQVQDLMNKGVKFYFCMNTTRGMKAAGKFNDTGDLVTSMDANGVTHSVGYVTAGITALADFQARGYTYVQP